MARKLRIEYPGAIYHVINRGNFRSRIFETEGAKAAFQKCLFAACVRSGWVLHAYVVMDNHYHLAIETPKGNLVSGMQWLQAAFANSFNRFRNARGHLFQGRYKAILVEDGDALGMVCHYIHLNPVRAKIVSVRGLRGHLYSSYWYLWRKNQRPPFLHAESALIQAGTLTDESKGWEKYQSYLEWQAEEGPAGKNKLYVKMSAGWALGTVEFKKALLRDHAQLERSRALDSAGVKEIKESQWSEALQKALAAIPPSQRKSKSKSADWKVSAALQLKDHTDAPNNWLAEKLQMGSGRYVSKHVGLLRKNLKGAT